ncbi:MAG: sugar phosphate isomerase/epimerase [Myxococcales bacterium]|nr:sugar phosphate isomerase/epimerase [Myxococcales bacterium]
MQLALDWWSYHHSLRQRQIDYVAMIRRAAELGASGVALEYFALPADWQPQPVRLLSLQSEMRLQYLLSFGIPLTALPTTWAWYGRHLKACLSLAAALSSPFICLPVREVHPLPTGPGLTLPLTDRQLVRRSVRHLQKLCRLAADRHLRVAIADDPGIAPETLREIVEAADCPNLGLSVGTHAGGREDPYRRVSLLAPWIVYLRCGDMARAGAKEGELPLGDGRIDFKALLRLLWRLEYRGFCGVRIDAPWRQSRREDEWVRRSFVHLAAIRETLQKEGSW